MNRLTRDRILSTIDALLNMRRNLYCAYLAVGLVFIAGGARAEGRWLQPMNGWDHNYVARAGSGSGSGVPSQYSGLWKNSGYQSSEPDGLSYAAIIPDSVEGDVLMLIHTNGVINVSPYYSMMSAPGAGTTNDLITMDCRFRLADDSQSADQPQFMLGVVRPRLDGTATGWNQWLFLFSKQKLKVNGTTLNVALGLDWHTLRLVADVARNTTSVYLDNDPLPIYNGVSSVYKDDTRTRNWTAFGDSGRTVNGEVHLKYLRWTTSEMVHPPICLHAGDVDPLTEGFTYHPENLTGEGTYKPENLEYAAANNFLPEAASPSWSKSGFEPGATWMTNDDVTGEAALHLVMTNTSRAYKYGHYTQNHEQGQFITNDLVTANFRFRLIDDSQADDQPQFQVSMAGPRPDGIDGLQLFYLRFAKDRIYYFNNSASLKEYPIALGTNWHNGHWRMNWNTRAAEVYLDGSPVNAFSHKSRLILDDINKNYTGFGDGSESITGIARLSYLRLARQTLAWQGGMDADVTPYWQGVDSNGYYGYYETAVPSVVMNYAQGWTASCKLKLPQASDDAFGVMMRCYDSASRWALTFTPNAYHYQNAAGTLVQLGSCALARQYQIFQMYFDPAGNSGDGTLSYYKNGHLIDTLTRADAYTNGSATNLFQWGCDALSSATSIQRWSSVAFAPGNRIIAQLPPPPLGTLVMLGGITQMEWETKRAEALNRPREVIYNNDGNEPFLWPTNKPFSIAGFLAMRTTPVLGSQVDSVFYCPISSGFGFLTADIPSADLMLRDLSNIHLGKKNVLQDFLDMGTDPVREVVTWCRTNNLEVFVSLRVNDTHDQGTDQTQVGPPYAYPGNALFSPFKIQYPKFLMGSYTNRPPYCSWSAVDFTHAAVRERLFQMCRDMFTHYDLDGLDLDFFRHMQIFNSVAWGGTASDAERDLMTELIRRIRAAAEKAGKQRGRPILISVRVPDSVPFCLDVGIDLETWLGEGLVDMVMTSGYWRHNPWQYTVDLCQGYNVKCYASLDESRLSNDALAPTLKRQTIATYRARAMAACRAGMDGAMYFNLFSSAAIKSFMRGNLENMRLDDKSYFVSYRGRQSGAKRYVQGAEQHFSLSELSVSAIAKIAPGNSRAFSIWIGDDIEALIGENIRPVCELLLDIALPEGAEFSVTVNGHAITGAVVEDRIQRYPLRLEDLICGENILEFSVAAGPAAQTVTLKDAAIFLTGFPKAD